MKTLLFIFALVTSLAADEYRTWTQLGSKKTIEAKIMDKEKGKVRLSMKDGKAHWLDVANLIEEDREFVESWKKKPLGFEPLTVSVTGKPGAGKKAISVTAKTWEKGAKLVVYYQKGGTKIECDVEIEPYGISSWSGAVANSYLVTLLDSDGTVISEQTATSKD